MYPAEAAPQLGSMRVRSAEVLTARLAWRFSMVSQKRACRCWPNLQKGCCLRGNDWATLEEACRSWSSGPAT